MARIHGKTGQILIDTTPSSPVVPVALADTNAFTIDMSTDKVDVTCFQDTNKQKVVGLPDFAGTISGFWNAATSPTFFAVVLAQATCWLRFLPQSSASTYMFEGLAYVDGSVNCSATGAVSFTGKWDAAGNWVMRP
jgi:hypothetical protein